MCLPSRIGPSNKVEPIVTFTSALAFVLLRCVVLLWLASPFVVFAQTFLPGTQPLTVEGDLAAMMVDGIHVFLDRKTQEMQKERDDLWDRADRIQFVTQSRQRFRRIIGAVDNRVPIKALELVGSTSNPAQIATGRGFKVLRVRWPVFEGVHGEGLLLQPDGPPAARVVASRTPTGRRKCWLDSLSEYHRLLNSRDGSPSQAVRSWFPL